MNWKKFWIDTLIMNIFWLPVVAFYSGIIVRVSNDELILILIGSVAMDTTLAGVYHRFYDDMFYHLYTKRKKKERKI